MESSELTDEDAPGTAMDFVCSKPNLLGTRLLRDFGGLLLKIRELRGLY